MHTQLVNSPLLQNPKNTLLVRILSKKKKKRILSFIPLGFPGGSVGKESACNAGDPVSISGLGRSPGEGNGNPLQYSCLENLMDRGAGQATVCRIVKSRTQLCDFHFTLHH